MLKAKRFEAKADAPSKASTSAEVPALPSASLADTNLPVATLLLPDSSPCMLPSIPLEIRWSIYENVIGGFSSLRVGISNIRVGISNIRVGLNAKGKAAVSTFNLSNEALVSHGLDEHSKAALKASVRLLLVNKQINAEFGPIFYARIAARIAIVMSFDAGPVAHAALDRFTTVSNPSLRSQLKHLTFQFRVMEGLGLKADKESLTKNLARLPNLKVLTLSVSDPCRDTSIDISGIDKASTRVRWMPSTLLRLQVVQRSLPQLTKAFFKNCKNHSREGWFRHAVRLTTESGTARKLEDFIDVESERKRYLATRKNSSLDSIPGIRY